jgi:glycosyltransferase involved in cell wall biosynthesis
MNARPPLILHVFPSFTAGGAQLRFVAVANHLGTAWRHAVVAMDGNTTCATRLHSALDVTYPSLSLRKGDLWGNMHRVREVLHRLRPEVLVTSNWGCIEWALALLWPLALSAPLRHIHTEDGFGPDEAQRQISRRVWLRRLALRRATVVVPSRTLWRLARDTWRLNPNNLCYIPNGVDLRGYGARPHNEQQNNPVIGAVAALRPEKNLARLLRAFHLMLQTTPLPGRIVIVGDGAERPRLQALAADLGLSQRVHFAGYAPDPRPFYANFDIVALTSDTEQMPLSVLEAMAAGLPVVATDVGDVRAMVAEPNAPFVVPPDDTAVADSLRRLLNDAQQRQEIGQANRVKAERHYDQQTMFAAYGALWARRTMPTENITERAIPWRE